jgi:hypothetical protein
MTEAEIDQMCKEEYARCALQVPITDGITVDHSVSYAPCCLILCKVTKGEWDRYGEDTILVQTDWEYPAYARDFGWNMQSDGCEHQNTDGTVDCPDCGRTASSFIQAAGEFLRGIAGNGMIVEDPGYFDGE